MNFKYYVEIEKMKGIIMVSKLSTCQYPEFVNMTCDRIIEVANVTRVVSKLP